MAPGSGKKKAVRIPKRWILAGGLGILWLGALVLVAVPAFDSALQRHREVQELETQLAELDSWMVAGMWLAPEVAAREPEVDKAWREAFPGRRGREELFLDIARAADASGLEGFDLKEMQLTADEDAKPALQGTLEALMGGGGSVSGIPVEVPRIDLRTYRLKTSFLTDYAGVSRFLGKLQRINRAMTVHNLDVRSDKGRIKVDLELDVYVSQAS